MSTERAAVIYVLVLLLVLASPPMWPFAVRWGYYPSGALGLVVLTIFADTFVGHRLDKIVARALRMP
jgi:hypothetical protein